MRIKSFALRYSPERGCFDETELQAFLDLHDPLTLHEHFFVREGEPVWALLVTYRDPPGPGEARPPGDPRKDLREEVAEADRSLFDALRSWRNDLARRDGRPPYILLSNRQVADLARLRPSTLTALKEISGIGQAKAEAFGEALLALIHSVPPHVPAPAPPTAGPSTNGVTDG